MKRLTILHLYPNEMSLYGDSGNVLVLKRRLEWRGFAVDISYHHPGANFSYTPDLVVGGGGQDSMQIEVARDIERIGPALRELVARDVPMLAVCGMYQLFGHQMATSAGIVLSGASIFDATTIATPERLVGEISIRTAFGTLHGFENHSGETFLHGSQTAFGTVLTGYGNTHERRGEGAVVSNTYGTYLHGCVLARNPQFADVLLTAALKNKGYSEPLPPLDKPLVSAPRHR